MFKSTGPVTGFQWPCEFVTFNQLMSVFMISLLSPCQMKSRYIFKNLFQNCLTESLSVKFIAVLLVPPSVLINSGQSGSVTESGISRNCSLGDLLLLLVLT